MLPVPGGTWPVERTRSIFVGNVVVPAGIAVVLDVAMFLHPRLFVLVPAKVLGGEGRVGAVIKAGPIVMLLRPGTFPTWSSRVPAVSRGPVAGGPGEANGVTVARIYFFVLLCFSLLVRFCKMALGRSASVRPQLATNLASNSARACPVFTPVRLP